MDMQPKLLAAADMCEAGEEVNLDELAFLLRYASDELASRPQAALERDRLVARLRQRVLARCELLQRPPHEMQKANEGSLAELEELEALLDHELRHRMNGDLPSEAPQPSTPEIPVAEYISGR